MPRPKKLRFVALYVYKYDKAILGPRPLPAYGLWPAGTNNLPQQREGKI